MVARVGDYGQNQRLTGTLLATQARARADQQAVASGKAASSYGQLGGVAGQLLRAEDAREGKATFVTHNERLAQRLQVADAALGEVVAIAERAKAMLVQRLNGATGAAVPVDTEAATMLEGIAAQLNAAYDGDYLFAGSRTDIRPVMLPGTPVTTADPALYYQGDEVLSSARIDHGQDLEHGVLASAPPFAQLIAALGTAGQAHAAGDGPGLQAALTQLETAFTGLVDMRAGLGVKAGQLEATTEAHRAGLQYLDQTISDIADVDLAQVMTRLAQDQASLEAAYVVTSKLNGLSLADYLR